MGGEISAQSLTALIMPGQIEKLAANLFGRKPEKLAHGCGRSSGAK
jgi:hypothetical protein